MDADAIPETALVGLIDRLNRTTRRNWADQGHLKKASRKEGYREADAVELAAFVQLIQADIGDFHETVAAWKEIRPRLKAAVTPKRSGIEDDVLVAVVDADTKEGFLVASADELGALAMPGGSAKRVLRVVDLSHGIRVAREAFWRLVDAREASTEGGAD